MSTTASADPAAMSLDQLGLLHGTDKASGVHGYLAAYEEFLAPLRAREITLIEIGVKEGASLRVWRDYFPRARIIGVDIRPKVRALAEPRIAIEVADQGNPEALARLVAQYGPFDVVVEDGSHRWAHQILAIQHLVPALRPGGIFISEDLQVSFPPRSERYAGEEPRSAFDLLRDLAEHVLRFRDAGRPDVADARLRPLVPLVAWVLFLRHAAILRRRG